ncbi:unnamed protein product [Ciceribacter sp. T2.26MG-112.2]|uniref:hypothetical protein n=1 Tax=Ciceribacter sp. T2.26MG-112.2 TaxID=3137154 RepID=UPI000E1ADF29|nr:hypothetical protein [Ciceribacter naphthalenivorans]SSC73119.1 unnamed protein product [Ciceribacter naphthalenivorans]
MTPTERQFLDACGRSSEAFPEYIDHNPAPELTVPGAGFVSPEIRAEGRSMFAASKARSKVEACF